MIVLIADDLGPISETIRSRCQLVPFRRLSERAVRELVDARAPQLDEPERAAVARVAAGRLDRLERLLDPASRERRDALIEQARAPYRAERFDPSDAAATLLDERPGLRRATRGSSRRAGSPASTCRRATPSSA